LKQGRGGNATKDIQGSSLSLEGGGHQFKCVGGKRALGRSRSSGRHLTSKIGLKSEKCTLSLGERGKEESLNGIKEGVVHGEGVGRLQPRAILMGWKNYHI